MQLWDPGLIHTKGWTQRCIWNLKYYHHYSLILLTSPGHKCQIAENQLQGNGEPRDVCEQKGNRQIWCQTELGEKREVGGWKLWAPGEAKGQEVDENWGHLTPIPGQD